MILTNNDKFVLVIDSLTERDEDRNAMVWGGIYYAYNHLAHILQ